MRVSGDFLIALTDVTVQFSVNMVSKVHSLSLDIAMLRAALNIVVRSPSIF